MNEDNNNENESYTRRRIENSPLNSFVINHISHATYGNSFNMLEKPELRKPTTEMKSSPRE